MMTCRWRAEPAHDPRSIPSLTEHLVHKTPFIGMTVMASALVGLDWLTTFNRRGRQVSNSTIVDYSLELPKNVGGFCTIVGRCW
jgi:hypothetical protein